MAKKLIYPLMLARRSISTYEICELIGAKYLGPMVRKSTHEVVFGDLIQKDGFLYSTLGPEDPSFSSGGFQTEITLIPMEDKLEDLSSTANYSFFLHFWEIPGNTAIKNTSTVTMKGYSTEIKILAYTSLEWQIANDEAKIFLDEYENRKVTVTSRDGSSVKSDLVLEFL